MLIQKKVQFLLLVGAVSITLWWLILHHVTSPIVKRLATQEKLIDVEEDEVVLTDNVKNLEDNKPFNGSDSIGLVKTKEDILIKEKGYSKHSFNILVSSRIAFNRNIPDVRDTKCVGRKYRKIALRASIIICFHNEAWSTLLRTVHSVVNRSPKHLIHEIILIDDHSELHEFTWPKYFHNHFPLVKVKVLRTEERAGLIRARLKGAEHASGDVLVFLDSHCEVNVNWLQPLLARIQDDKKTVVCPVIDTINPHTFAYETSPPVRGGFNWGMHFNWEPIPPDSVSDFSQPFRTPTMSGGLFAMDRKYFFHLGSYDKAMEIWGGENLELSFRIWMCGGRLEIIPCSRVGHVFRDRRPYGDGGRGDTMAKNSLRLVEVWLDKYKLHFYDLRPELKGVNVDVELRRSLRRKLKCKSFKWYLDVVYPELGIPMVRDGLQVQNRGVVDSAIRTMGKLENVGFQLCFDTHGDPNTKMSSIVLRKCKKTMTNKLILNFADELKITKKLCLGIMLYTHTKNQARTMKCHGAKSGQEWKLKSSQHLYNPALGMCLAGTLERMVITQICNSSSQAQKWKFIDVRKQY